MILYLSAEYTAPPGPNKNIPTRRSATGSLRSVLQLRNTTTPTNP